MTFERKLTRKEKERIVYLKLENSMLIPEDCKVPKQKIK